MPRRLPYILLAVFLIYSCPAAAGTYGYDFYFGMGTASVGAAEPWLLSNGVASRPSMDGAFGTAGGALMLSPSFGVGAQASFRFRQGTYADFGYRPVFYDFNGIWAPGLTMRLTPEFQAGFGGVSTSFYDPSSPYFDYYSGQFSTLVGRSNHLQLHAGAGMRILLTDRVFVRPQLDYHWVRNMWEFNRSSVLRYSIAVGYSLPTE